MAIQVDRLPVNSSADDPCRHNRDVVPHVHRPPRQVRLALIITSTLAVLLFLSNGFLGYHYYRNMFPAADSSAPAPQIVPASAISLANQETTLTRLYETAERAVVKVVVVKNGSVDVNRPNPRGDGLGSGVIFDRQGHVVTNHHVIDEASDVAVQLADGRVLRAKIVGHDAGTDLAVLQINIPAADLTVIPFVDSDTVQVGQSAVAIGYPFGLDKSLTVGHISGLNRMTPSDDKYTPVISKMIQTDAAINPGNSGGPLLNLRGELVGINTSLFSLSRGWQGVGFAVPSNTVRRVTQELLARGYVSRPYLGAVGLTINPRQAQHFGLDSDHGLLIQEVSRNSPAWEAGLRAGNRTIWTGRQSIRLNGDILLAVNGLPVDSMTALSEILQARRIGQTLTLTILRHGEETELTATLTEQPIRK